MNLSQAFGSVLIERKPKTFKANVLNGFSPEAFGALVIERNAIATTPFKSTERPSIPASIRSTRYTETQALRKLVHIHQRTRNNNAYSQNAFEHDNI